MSRIASWAAILIAPALLSCAHVPPLDVPPLPAGCEEFSGATLTLRVDGEARVDKPCVRVRARKTNVVWESAPDLSVLVAFQKGTKPAPPKDPGCRGRGCELPRWKVIGEPGVYFDYKYTVVVVRANGSVASVDPRLIIWP